MQERDYSLIVTTTEPKSNTLAALFQSVTSNDNADGFTATVINVGDASKALATVRQTVGHSHFSKIECRSALEDSLGNPEMAVMLLLEANQIVNEELERQSENENENPLHKLYCLKQSIRISMVGWCDMVESDSVILYRFTCIIIPSYIAAFACIT